MPELNREHLDAVMDTINRCPYFTHLSMAVRELAPGRSTVELDIGSEHLNPFGGLHGGVYASAIDTAAYWSVYCEVGEGVGFTTVDLKVDFLAPAGPGKMIVKGNRIKVGRTICLAEASAFDGRGKLVAHGTSKMIVVPGLQTMGDVVDFMGGGGLPPKFAPPA